MAEEIIKGRVWTKVDTLENWNNNPLLLGPGEMALVTTPSGIPLNMKWGDKNERKRFSDLPFAISYDQGQFVIVDGPGELPTPESDVAYSLVGPGTYTYPGQGDIVVDDGRWGQVVYNDGEWSFIDMGELPQPDIDKTDTISEPSELVTTEKAVLDYSTPLNSLRIFPSNFEVHEFDRPDLDLETPFVEIDKNGVLISPNINLDYSILENYGMTTYDRPDLGGIVEVDREMKMMSPEYSGISDSKKVDSLYSRLFHEPSVVDEFSQTDSDVIVYDEIISKWEDIRAKANQQLNYVTRQEIGRTSSYDVPVYRYDFAPNNPKVKILATTGMHGSEKVYIKLLHTFFDRMVSNWGNDPLLEWIRFNVHFIVVPVLSPSCTEGLVPGTGGGRRVHETEPIPVSWTKVGNTATVTFDISDFPDTNGRLDAASYFSNPNIVGKTWVSIFDSTNTALASKGYLIQSVVNGNTITVQTDNEISGEGTARLYVGVDINRNMQSDGSDIWDNFTPSTTMTMYSNDYVSNPNDNKGTKPFSLSESIILKELIDNNPDILFYLDLHSGAGTNYLHWNTKTYPGQAEAFEEVMQHQGAFNSDGFSRVIQDATNIPYAYKYCVDTIDKPGFTIEWEQVATTTEKSATDAFRWMATSIISLVRNLK